MLLAGCSAEDYSRDDNKTSLLKTPNAPQADSTFPSIVLHGAGSVEIYQHDSYKEEGYEAKDKEDGDITAKVRIKSTLDVHNVGNYKIVYTVADRAHHEVNQTRYISVRPQDDIRVHVIEESSLGEEYYFTLWDYWVRSSSKPVVVQKFSNNIKIKNQLNTISKTTESEEVVKLPYTRRELQYLKTNNTLTINFKNGQKNLKTLKLKSHVARYDSIFYGGSNGCKIIKHYDKISLAGDVYEDVIQVRCKDVREAYFAKYKGIVVDNILTNDTPKDEADESTKGSVFVENEIKIPRQPYALTENNLQSIRKSNAETLFSSPYNLSGKGITVGVIDAGGARVTHREFDNNRVENITKLDIHRHTTHVVGTIAAKGLKEDARGFANRVKVKVDSFNHLYNARAMYYFYNSLGIEITNHSYGSDNPDYQGVYEWDSRKADYTVFKQPNIIAVKSAGNDRGRAEYSDYSCIKRVANAKNIITVGAIEEDNSIAYFSSTGPLKSGRIKPDLVAKGRHIYSVGSMNDTSYVDKSGTSMSAPAVTGVLALMQEEYIKVNGKKMREDIAKGILVNSAQDLGRAGPDGEYGYGLINALEAVKTIDTMNANVTLVQDQSIRQGEKHLYTINIDQEMHFKATLSWIDPVQEYSDLHVDLFTDLDLMIIDMQAKVRYAYTLDGEHPAQEAKQDRRNKVDNVEQVETILEPGIYMVVVDSEKMQGDSQAYALISNVPLGTVESVDSDTVIDEFETLVWEMEAQ